MGSPNEKHYWGLGLRRHQTTRSGDGGCRDLVGINGARLMAPRYNRACVWGWGSERLERMVCC
ncbi:unnamed protein product [Blumeria hordei]|uniref:Uncharacterized protein n=1 Tax=Blumeria hordei TaxID=2867405 RepID=A0A383UWK6_BLUHO|nr:unnamed protein product [Blumeria hordei]